MKQDRVSNQDSQIVEISGKVTGINNRCNSDGMCSVTLDNKAEIITSCGLTAKGTCASYDQSKLSIGQTIKAKVRKQDNHYYNLECKGCTITP